MMSHDKSNVERKKNKQNKRIMDSVVLFSKIYGQ